MSRIPEQRILDCLNIDKKKRPNGLNEIIKADIIKTLNSYFDIDENEILIKIDVLPNGKQNIKMVAKANSVKPLNFLR